MNRTVVRVEDRYADGMRLDRYISEVLALCSRSQLKQRVLEVRVDDRIAKLSHRLAVGQTVDIQISDPERHDIRPEKMELSILYESSEVVVLDKPQGVVVHPAAGNFSGTLVQGLAYHFEGLGRALSSANPRPGIVHRLDKDTSGVIIVAKNPEAQEFLARQFRRRYAEKRYLALVKGRVTPPSGTIRSCIRRDPRNRKRFISTESEGKLSITDYRVLRQWERHAFVLLQPKTGRTHQIRVHMAQIGHPVLGDPVYGRVDDDFPRAPLMLHAYRLVVELPRAKSEAADDTPPFPADERGRAHFRAPLPERFKSALRLLAGRPAGPI